jgi:hypothetical protein
MLMKILLAKEISFALFVCEQHGNVTPGARCPLCGREVEII